MANFSPAYFPVFRAFDANGNPLAGGKLYSYAAGSTTPVATYTDASGGTENTNPVILDANGEAPVWLGQDAYKFVLKDANDATLWTADGIKSVDELAKSYADALEAELASTASGKGAALVGYKNPLAGATSRTLHTKAQEIVSVKDFGAVGDGLTDDTLAIQSAIEGITSGDVIFPAGDYYISTISGKSNVRLIGQNGARLIKQSGTSGDNNNALNIYGAVTATSSLAAADVDSGAVSVTVADGSVFASGDWCLLRDNTWAYTGVAGRNQEIVQVASVAGNVVSLNGSTLGPYTVSDTAELVKITPIENAVVSNLAIVIPTGTNTGGGIAADLNVGLVIEGCNITGPNDNAGIYVSRSYNSFLCRNTIKDGQSLASSGYAYAISIGESSTYTRVIGNHQTNVRESNATNRARQVIFACNTSDNAKDTHFNTHGSWCDGVVIANNVCNGSEGYGYSVGHGTHKKGDENVIVCGNVVRNCNSHGISVNAPSGKENSNVSISNNHIYSYGSNTGSSGVVFSYTNGGLIVGNHVNANGNNAASVGIQVVLSSDVLCSSNHVLNLTNGYGITINTCTNVCASGNRANDISSSNFRCVGTNSGCSIINNSADDTSVTIDATTICYGNSWQVLSGSATYDPASLSDGTGATTTVTVTGAALGDYVENVSFGVDLQGVMLTAYVSAPNTVAVRFQNETGGPIDLASSTLKVRVSKAQGA